VLQCAAVSCSVSQWFAISGSMLQRVAVCCNVLQKMKCTEEAVFRYLSHHPVAVQCTVLQCTAVRCSALQCGAVW